jgi:hypothetical protein
MTIVYTVRNRRVFYQEYFRDHAVALEAAGLRNRSAPDRVHGLLDLSDDHVGDLRALLAVERLAIEPNPPRYAPEGRGIARRSEDRLDLQR